jgi:DNA-binding NtrC family response regulator
VKNLARGKGDGDQGEVAVPLLISELLKGIAMENGSMINTSTDANFQALVVDDESQALRDEGWYIIGRSQAFIEVMKQVGRVAGTNSPILLTGEPGTGKELVAAAIHNRSSRRDQPFVTVNCASVPAEAIEGLLEDADGGTILLKEITETAQWFQEKLLRLLQTGEFTRTDTDHAQTVNVRVLAATSRNVEQEVAAGKFCQGLFDCLSVASTDLPPLHERPGDIPPQSNGAQSPATEPVNDDWVTLSVIEGRYVARVLEHTHGNKQAAARVLAVDRKTLDRMIKRHHIDSQHLKTLRAKAVSHS